MLLNLIWSIPYCASFCQLDFFWPISYCLLWIITFLYLQVGEAALSILHYMVSAHSDLDDAGEIVTPTPRVKRILSSPRCLPHVAQVSFVIIF